MSETTFQTVRRWLYDGYWIFMQQGLRALLSAAMLEAARIVDSTDGPYLAPRNLLTDGRAFVRSYGTRVTIGAVLRQVAVANNRPHDRRPNRSILKWHKAQKQYFHAPKPAACDSDSYALRPCDECDFALETPFRYAPRRPTINRIAAIIHAFYPDTLYGILDRLRNIPIEADLFLSTDTPSKSEEIARQTVGWTRGTVEIRLAPNRGRDIAPKLVTFRDVYEHYEVFLHLHSKKSLHAREQLAGWRDYLLDNLIGHPEVALSNLSLFTDSKLGFVFPQHMFSIRRGLNWGQNYSTARALMLRLGVEINRGALLEFPSGSMFWGRSAAFRPLLDLNLAFDDFPEESGQIDGTLAHAIERIILMAGETRGFEWSKIVRRELYPLDRTILRVRSPEGMVQQRLRVFRSCLTPINIDIPSLERAPKDEHPIDVNSSRN